MQRWGRSIAVGMIGLVVLSGFSPIFIWRNSDGDSGDADSIHRGAAQSDGTDAPTSQSVPSAASTSKGGNSDGLSDSLKARNRVSTLASSVSDDSPAYEQDAGDSGDMGVESPPPRESDSSQGAATQTSSENQGLPSDRPLPEPSADGPDLVVISLWADDLAPADPLIEGDPIMYHATVLNQGNLAAGQFQVGFYEQYSSDSYPPMLSSLTPCCVQVPGLNPGEGATVNVSVSLAFAHDFIRARADNLNEVSETDETNNDKDVNFLEYPDYATVSSIEVEDLDPADELMEGDPVIFRVVVGNLGGGSKLVVDVRWLERYWAADSGGYITWDLGYVNGLVIPSGETRWANLSVPSVDAHEWVRAEAMPHGREYSHGNNARQDGPFVGYPNIVPSSPIVPRVLNPQPGQPEDRPIDGQNVEYCLKVANVGESTKNKFITNWWETYTYWDGSAYAQSMRVLGTVNGIPLKKNDETTSCITLVRIFETGGARAHDMLYVDVNTNGDIRQTSEADDQKSGHFIDYADYVMIRTWWTPRTIVHGQPVTFHAYIMNQNASTVTNQSLLFRVSYLRSSYWVDIGTATIPPLASGQYVNVSMQVPSWTMWEYCDVLAIANTEDRLEGGRVHDNDIKISAVAMQIAEEDEFVYPWYTINEKVMSWTIYTYWSTELHHRITGNGLINAYHPYLRAITVIRQDNAFLNNLFDGNPETIKVKNRETVVNALTAGYAHDYAAYGSHIDAQARKWVDDAANSWIPQILDLLDLNPSSAPREYNVYQEALTAALKGAPLPESFTPYEEIADSFKEVFAITRDARRLMQLLSAIHTDDVFRQILINQEIKMLGYANVLYEQFAASTQVLEESIKIYWMIGAIQAYIPYLESLRQVVTDNTLRDAIDSLLSYDFSDILDITTTAILEKWTVTQRKGIIDAILQQLRNAGYDLIPGLMLGLNVGLMLAEYTGWDKLYANARKAAIIENMEALLTSALAIFWSYAAPPGPKSLTSLTNLRTTAFMKINTAANFYWTAADAAEKTWSGLADICKRFNPTCTDVHEYIPIWQFTALNLETIANLPVPGWISSSVQLGKFLQLMRSPRYCRDGSTCVGTAPGIRGGQPPVAVIDNPKDGDMAYSGVRRSLTGSSSSDPENDSLTFEWSSSIDGYLACTAETQVYLSPGTHVITLNVSDGMSVSSAQVTLFVNGSNRLPFASITQPVDGSSMYAGTVILLNASASWDLDGGPLTYLWSSNISGVIGTDELQSWEPPVGFHRITLTVSDGAAIDKEEMEIYVHERVPRKVYLGAAGFPWGFEYCCSIVRNSSAVETASGPQDQWEPDIDGYRVVYADIRNGNWDIYMYDFLGQRETRITTSVDDQRAPAISGDYIVWLDDRRDALEPFGVKDWDLFLYQISTGRERRLTTFAKGTTLWGPQISGDLIVWADERARNWDIRGYSISARREFGIAVSPSDEIDPEVSGDTVVWSENGGGNWDVAYCKPCSIYQHTAIRISSHPSSQFNPYTDGMRIVFNSNESGNKDVYLYDIMAHSARRITADAANQWAPVIEGNWVVYLDARQNASEDPWSLAPSGDYVSIYAYNLLRRREVRLALQISDKRDLALSDGRLVWADNFGQLLDNESGLVVRDWDIFWMDVDVISIDPPPIVGHFMSIGGPSASSAAPDSPCGSTLGGIGHLRYVAVIIAVLAASMVIALNRRRSIGRIE